MKKIAIFLLIIGILLFFFISIIFLKIHIQIDGFYTENEQQLNLTIYTLFKLIRIERNLLLMLKEENQEVEKKEEIKKGRRKKKKTDNISLIKMFIKNMSQIHTIVKKVLKRITVKEWTWHTYIGTGDAALTGMFSGLLWTIKGWIIGGVTHYFLTDNEPEIEVNPIYEGELIATKLHLHVSFRIWIVLLFGISLLKYRWKVRKDLNITGKSTVEQGGV